MSDNPNLRQLIVCRSAADREAADRLTDFLEAGLPVRVHRAEGLITPDLDLVEAAEIALSADAALVLLSPDSVPAKWVRERWEEVFIGERAVTGCQFGFVLLRPCEFPALLRRKYRFFDCSSDFLPVARRIKQWLLDAGTPPSVACAADLEPLRFKVADRPGVAEDVPAPLALRFASECGRDFRAVYRVGCRNRSEAGVLGHTGHLTGVRLAGTAAENRESLVRHCAEHRDLFLFEELPAAMRGLVSFGGLASTVFAVSPEPAPAVTARAVCDAFFAPDRSLERCAEWTGEATALLPSLLAADYETGKRLGFAVLAVLRTWDRSAEASELLEAMLPAVCLRADDQARMRVERELCWLLDKPSRDWTPQALAGGAEQMSLFGTGRATG